MQTSCQRCGSITDASSRFCTNCGAVREISQPYQQSWQTPATHNQTQVPSWAQASGGISQQQMYAGTQNQSAGGGLGFGGPGDTTAKKLLVAVLVTIVGAILLLVGSITLALVTPSPISTFFWVLAVVIFVLAWSVYSFIRRMIRRTIGSFWRLL